MISRTTASLATTLLLTVAACATQNAGAGFDEPDDGDPMMDEGGTATGGTANKGGTGISISGSTSKAGSSAAGKGGSTSLPPAGTGGKAGSGSGGKGGKGGSGGGSGSGGMDAAGGSDDGPTNMPIAGLTLTFKPESMSDPYDFIGGELQLTNDTAQPLDYGTLKIRYYFTNEITTAKPDVKPAYSQNWAIYGSNAVTHNTECAGTLVKLPTAKTGADSYMEIHCDAPGTLAAGNLLKISWKAGIQNQGVKFVQDGDWSFKDPGKIVVIDDNNIVWGVEP